MTEDAFKKILDHLKQHLMKRALYRFDLDQNAFIQDCITALNDDLRHKSDTYEYEISLEPADSTMPRNLKSRLKQTK